MRLVEKSVRYIRCGSVQWMGVVNVSCPMAGFAIIGGEVRP
jgi:hypothetical protein